MLVGAEDSHLTHLVSLDFCVGVAHGSRNIDVLRPPLDLAEPPIAFWHRQTDKLLSFNGAFAALVEYTPADLLADFHSALLDRYGRLTGINNFAPSTIEWIFETGCRKLKRVVLTIIPLSDQILWLPREVQPDRPPSPILQSPLTPYVPCAASPPAAVPPMQRELIKSRSNTKRPWADSVVKFNLKTPKEKE